MLGLGMAKFVVVLFEFLSFEGICFSVGHLDLPVRIGFNPQK